MRGNPLSGNSTKDKKRPYEQSRQSRHSRLYAGEPGIAQVPCHVIDSAFGAQRECDGRSFSYKVHWPEIIYVCSAWQSCGVYLVEYGCGELKTRFCKKHDGIRLPQERVARPFADYCIERGSGSVAAAVLVANEVPLAYNSAREATLKGRRLAWWMMQVDYQGSN
jgi:hypothetical protein